MTIKITKRERKLIDGLVSHYSAKQANFRRLADLVATTVKDDQELFKHIHSIKSRSKDPSHLRDKLIRKLTVAKKEGAKFEIGIDNLFSKVTDLAGVRIIHLHNQQMPIIHEKLMALFDENSYTIIEPAIANTWDDESKEFYKTIGINTRSRANNMYTSVHYVIATGSKIQERCEIQVRTLMEEVWGEVDHSINYPHPATSIHCKEQLKVLARLTSSCTRLVDSIFLSYKEDCLKSDK